MTRNRSSSTAVQAFVSIGSAVRAFNGTAEAFRPFCGILTSIPSTEITLESQLERKFRLNDCIIVYTSLENSGSSESASSRVSQLLFVMF